MGIMSFMNQKYFDLTFLKVSELTQMDFTEEEMQVCMLLDKYGAKFQWTHATLLQHPHSFQLLVLYNDLV